MRDTPRYLITTADERTWKLNEPVVFLGEWCRVYGRRHVWQKMDSIVAAPYGLSVNEKDADGQYARALEEKLLPRVREILNEYHNSQFDLRGWKVIIGHWLRRLIHVVLNRVRTLQACFSSHVIAGTTTINRSFLSTVPMNSAEASGLFNNDIWNNILYARIMSILEMGVFPVYPLDCREVHQSPISRRELKRQSMTRRFLKGGLSLTSRLAASLARRHDPVIVASYLRPKEEIKLHLSLRQAPQLWRTPSISAACETDTSLRCRLGAAMLAEAPTDEIHSVLAQLLFELIPRSYLEGFDHLKEASDSMKWPRNPEFIFTSNRFDTDDVFKQWTAQKISEGVPYIVGQHGNNYGTFRYAYPTVEEETADRFFTWGWSKESARYCPAFVFKTVGSNLQHSKKGGLLLVEVSMPHRRSTWDDEFEFHKYFEEQQAFVRELDEDVQANTTIKLHSWYVHFRWNELDRWRDAGTSAKVDYYTLNIDSLIARSRLLIYSYDSTGILENLQRNIPTLAFWQNGLDHVVEEEKPYYELLVSAGIVHLSPESAADKVNKIWRNVEAWWSSKTIQLARQAFCNRYARDSEHPIKQLKHLLRREAQYVRVNDFDT